MSASPTARRSPPEHPESAADIDMTDADADGDTESDKSSPPSNPFTATSEEQQVIALIVSYQNLTRRLKKALTRMDAIIRMTTALHNRTRATFAPQSSDVRVPLSVQELIWLYRIPSADELDELQRSLHKRIIFDVSLATEYMIHTIGGTIAFARRLLAPCHQPDTYIMNNERHERERERRRGLRLSLTTETAVTPAQSLLQNDGREVPTESTQATTATATAITTIFSTPRDLITALRKDHMLCSRAASALEVSLTCAFPRKCDGNSTGSGNDGKTTTNTASRSSNRRYNNNSVAFLMQLQWFEFIARRGPRLDGDAHRREVYVAFEDLTDAQEESNMVSALQAERALRTACWEWQGWLAGQEVSGVVELMRSFKNSVLSEIWIHKDRNSAAGGSRDAEK
ncbi:uncharacterized protein LTHEOB_7343 [Lasiodiplodia theobromae]|uniref:uncharacterized protein n=1 Tax=Lasiodiplodia theobromae TaxID=45133 RepID=UPI0015C3B218|nr:uncharacterized protein LTHEOB_7343 [Lasiodiplodia theobromae]KAF4542613.1 hypothetical protein LTHEOB_7343 [Lasiodiplodia theobromae]